jgi:hypothetical protein
MVSLFSPLYNTNEISRITAHIRPEERLQRQRTIAATRRPDTRTSASNPVLAPNVEKHNHERSASDSFLPKLMQRVRAELFIPPAEPYRSPTKLSSKAQSTAGPSARGQESQDNLIDLDTGNIETHTDKLASFSPLTPKKNNESPSPSNTNYELVTPSLSRVSISDFEASGGSQAEDLKTGTSANPGYNVSESGTYADIDSEEDDMSEMFYKSLYD